jgi:hypothetical protein
MMLFLFVVSTKEELQLNNPHQTSDQLNRHNVLEHDASLRYVLVSIPIPISNPISNNLTLTPPTAA